MTEPTMPHVTIITPSYNAEACIMRAIDSALAQTFGDFELVVIDDASADGTAALVALACREDERITLIRLGQNGGAARARNAGLAAARGTWIALLDADDAWEPDRLARLLEHTAGADAVFDNLAEYDLATGTAPHVVFPNFPEGTLTIEALLSPQVPGSSHDFGYLKPLMRRAFLASKGLRYDEGLRRSQDLVLYVTMLLEGARTRTIDAPLYIYTPPVSRAAGTLSPHTNFVPRDDSVRVALERLRARFAGRMSEVAERALERRIAFLRRVGPVSDFYHARRLGNYRRMAALLASKPAVRREVARKIWQRLHWPGVSTRRSTGSP